MCLNSFWKVDFEMSGNMYFILKELSDLYPYEGIELVEFLCTLAGKEKYPFYSEVMGYIDQMGLYSTLLEDPELLQEVEENQGPPDFDRITKEQINEHIINIPVNTRAKIRNRGNIGAPIVTYSTKYSIWTVIFAHLTQFLHNQHNDIQLILSYIKLLSKIIQLVHIIYIYIYIYIGRESGCSHSASVSRAKYEHK